MLNFECWFKMCQCWQSQLKIVEHAKLKMLLKIETLRSKTKSCHNYKYTLITFLKWFLGLLTAINKNSSFSKYMAFLGSKLYVNETFYYTQKFCNF
jgi:hypothetical protein